MSSIWIIPRYLTKLTKFLDMGVNGQVYDWIKAFLTNRIQFVTVNGFEFEPQSVISGVPQGSALGPLIFLVLVEDIDKDVSSDTNVKSFEDATCATRGVKLVADTICLRMISTKYSISRK